jgi:hypothetical protein
VILNDDGEFTSNHDVMIEWLADNGFRPYIHDTGSYRACLGEYMLIPEVHSDRYAFHILVALMTVDEYENLDRLVVSETANDMNLKLLHSSIKAVSIGPVGSLSLNNSFSSPESMVFSLGQQLNLLHSTAKDWQELCKQQLLSK